MSKDSESRRAWIKNVAIIFLVVLLLLTFFSNTILNYTLPEVSAQYAQYGSITSSVKVDGTVKANESYSVIYEADQAEAEDGTIQSRKVVSVYVKEGDVVSIDTPILALQGGASEQLKKTQDEYDQLKREYDLALLNDTVVSLTSDKTISDAVQAVENQKKLLAELKEEYTAVLTGVDTTSIVEARIDALEEEIADLNDLIAEQNQKVQDVKAKIQSAESAIEEDIFSTLTIAEKLAIAEEDYAVAEQSYTTLSAEVKILKEELDRIQSSSGDIDKANTLTNEIRTLEESLEKLELERERYIEDYHSADEHDKLWETYLTAKNNYESYERQFSYEISRIPEYQAEYDAAKSVMDKYSQEYTTEIETRQAQNPDKSLESIIQEIKDTTEIYKNFDKAQKDCNIANEPLQYAIGCQEGLSTLKLALETAEKALEAYAGDSNDSTYERKLEDYDNQIEALERQISDARDKLDIIGLPEVDDVIDYATTYDLAEAQRKYDEKNAELTEITKTYEEAKSKVESLRKQNTASGTVAEYTLLLETYETDLDNLEAQLKQKNKELEAQQKELGKAETPAEPEELLKQIETAETSIKDLEAKLEITKATETQSGKTTEFARADQLKKLAELEAKIEEYKNAPENTNVNAPVAGRIVSIDVVPGNTVTSGQTVARIEIADKGYICEISMAAEEARKIQIGAECTISNSWWYSDLTASVTQIRSDPQSQGKNRIVVITVNGDVYEGQNLSFTIGDRSQSYDCVLPNSAIREDNDGKFVLTVTSKKTPLGVRYTAVRCNIEVIASDDTKSAVSGLYGSEFVITNATSPISDKQQVRLADENG